MGHDDGGDIIELVLAGHQRILLMQQAPHEASYPGGQPGSAQTLATVWDQLAHMIEMHTAAEQEVCYLPMLVASSWSREQLEGAVADLDDIREPVAEARLRPAGSRSWWRASP